MTRIDIISTGNGADRGYSAVSGDRRSVGSTPGEALDALTAQLPETETGTLLIVQSQQPDEFFGAAQQARLLELMQQWRDARDRGDALAPELQAELDTLVQEEIDASARRAGAIAESLSP